MVHFSDHSLSPRAEIFKALGHPTRLFIATRLREVPHSVSELTRLIGADTSTVSKHLSVLKNAGVIRGQKEGTTVYYRLVCDCLGEMFDATETILQLRAADARAALKR